MPARAACISSYSQLNCLTLRQLPSVHHGSLIPRPVPYLQINRLLRREFRTSTQRCDNAKHERSDDSRQILTTKSLKQSRTTEISQDNRAGSTLGKNGRTKPKITKPIWRPTNAQGARDLAALLDSIKAMTVQSKAVDVEQQENAEDAEDDMVADTMDIADDDLPLSPLEVLKGKRNHKPKRRPTREELAKLRSNPWAKMLAASLRQCAATRMRFPAPLMLDIGQVVNPTDLEVYLMPDTIADLQDFNKRLQSGKMSKAISLKGGTGDRLRILPYQLTFEKLTDTFIAYDTKSKQGRTRSGVVSKALFPSRWVQNTEKLTAYNNASKDYYNIAEKQGLEDDIHQRPKPIFDADKILWQPAIVERIPNIMRQRILLCLKRIAEVDLKYNDGSLKHLYRFEWPADTELDLSIVDQDLSMDKDFWNDMGDIEAEGAISGTGQGQGSPVGGRAPITIQPHELDAEASRHQSDFHAWAPGSFLLHLGPPHIADQIMPNSTDDLSNSLQLQNTHHGKFIPPMMTLGTYRLPVFNLYAMFGTQFTNVLSSLLAKYSIFRPESALATENSNADVPNLNTNANFLVLVKSTAPCSHFLVRELWQLWRYIGGTDCFIPENKEGVPRKTKVDITHSMSPQAWNHLYQLLDMPRSDAAVLGKSQKDTTESQVEAHSAQNV